MLNHLQRWEEKGVSFAERVFPWSAPHVRKYQRLLRYLVAGGCAAAIDFAFLFLFTDIFGVHYLLSSVLAFLVAFIFSFLVQKFWTFQDHSTENLHMQAVLYFVVAGVNLLLNTLLMYVFVEWFSLWYILAQFIASGLIAIESFFVSRYVIFKGGSVAQASAQ